MSDALRVLALLALVAANAFFVIGEYSIVTARRSAVARRGGGGAAAALKLMEDPVRVISTVQVGITGVGILTGAVGEPLVRDLLGDWIPTWVAFLIAFAVVTYLSVVLGELVPKALTLDRAATLAALVARPVTVMARVLAPAVWVLQGSAELLLRPFGVREVMAGDTIRSADELRALVDEAEQSGVIPRAQEELLHGVFDFATREALDVMVPAADVVWLDADLSAARALEFSYEKPHGRYPVGDGSLDRLIGVIHFRELVAAARDDAPIRERANPALIIPETKDLGALLRELREQHQQLAIVVDEYGATSGIVALEDILEEIVGEIEDEYSLPDSTLEWLDDRTVRVAGSMTIDDFNETVGTALPKDDARTMAGLIFHALGRRPRPADAVEIDGVGLTVEAVDGNRITRLSVRTRRDATPS
jgi:putative hemolysin